MGIIFCVIVTFAIVIIIAISWESKQFNKGRCLHCNNKLRNFSTDSQGGRGYICDTCGYTVWVSYNVDKKYIK